jgi:hypothetical protein
MARAMSEATLQQNILGAAAQLGYRRYHTRDSRGSQRGFPDLCLVHTGQDRCVFAELKTEAGRTSVDQRAWGADLISLTVVEYYLWRPSDWLSGDIIRTLTARPA